MRRWLLCAGIMGLILMGLQAQDPVFSQFYAAPLQLNPAFVGTTVAPRVAFNYRNQYPGWPNAYVTYSASYEQEVESLNSGIGLMVTADVAGDGIYKTNYASAVYGYKVRVTNDLYAKFGMEVGLIQANVDWDRLVFEDQIDPITGSTDPSGNPFPTEEIRPNSLTTTLFDASAGVLFYTGPVYLGVSLKHLNRPNENFLRLNENLFAGRPMRITLHAGAEFDLARRNKRGNHAFISPNVLFVKQGDTGQVNVGAYLGMGRVFGGAWFRHNFTLADAAIFSLGVREGVFRIAYSYDFTVSELAAAPGGTGNTHEISFMINLEDSEALRRSQNASRWNNCFKMFQ